MLDRVYNEFYYYFSKKKIKKTSINILRFDKSSGKVLGGDAKFLFISLGRFLLSKTEMVQKHVT